MCWKPIRIHPQLIWEECLTCPWVWIFSESWAQPQETHLFIGKTRSEMHKCSLYAKFRDESYLFCLHAPGLYKLKANQTSPLVPLTRMSHLFVSEKRSIVRTQKAEFNRSLFWLTALFLSSLTHTQQNRSQWVFHTHSLTNGQSLNTEILLTRTDGQHLHTHTHIPNLQSDAVHLDSNQLFKIQWKYKENKREILT